MVKENYPDAEPNELICPKCRKQLFDLEPDMLLMSSPPKLKVGCLNSNCDYQGFRIA